MMLKTKNLPIVISFVLFNFFVFAIVNDFSWFSWDFLKGFKISKNELAFPNPLTTFSLYTAVLVVNHYFPEKFKNSIVLWKIRDPLPGCRAFTELVKSDPRIDIDRLTRDYGSLPVIPVEQNRLWYRIYKSKEKDPVIISSHAAWLLFRDMASIALIFMLALSPMTLIHTLNYGSAIYSGMLFVQYVILAIIGQNTAERFACNVLAR